MMLTIDLIDKYAGRRQRAEGRGQKGRGFWTNLLFVTYFGFFVPFYLINKKYEDYQEKVF